MKEPPRMSIVFIRLKGVAAMNISKNCLSYFDPTNLLKGRIVMNAPGSEIT